MVKFFRWLSLVVMISALTGCFYWVRAYQTYRQMDEFDQHFAITSADEFSVHFKDPILYSDDFVSLAKLQPTTIIGLGHGKKWRYLFHKVDEQGVIIQPEISFYFDLDFNAEDRLITWSFSSLFLQIAPAEFIEVSFRSLGSAEINKEKRQIKANPDLIKKISADLPKKINVLSQLGQPLSIEDKQKQDVLRYHFLLQTRSIEEGYEDRALSVLKLSFDKGTDELIKMKGRFAGLKISIDYRKYLDDEDNYLVQVLEKAS